MPHHTLEGTAWQLAAIDGAAVAVGSEATMAFAGGRVSGSSGCNRYNATYVTGEGDAIQFSPAGATMMLCPDPQMRQEAAFFDALRRAVRCAVADAVLTFWDEAGAQLATFVPRKSETLIGAVWSATGINNRNNAVVSLAGARRSQPFSALMAESPAAPGAIGTARPSQQRATRSASTPPLAHA